MAFGLGHGFGFVQRSGAITLTMTGLTSDEARPGDHASISVGFPTGVTAWSAQAWGVGTYGDDTYGTGGSPTDYTASDGLTLLWEGTGDDGKTYRASAPIRYAVGSFAALTNQSFTDDTGDQTYVFDAATGTGLTWTYALVSPLSGVTIVSATRTITFDTDALALQTGTAISVSATDQYGRAATGSPRSFDLDIVEASFDPADLFASGEDGTWLEQAATHSFTSTTALTNPTATNTAGLWISRDGGAGYSGSAFTGLGSELVTNGTFDTTTTGWTESAVGAISSVSGRLRVEMVVQFDRARQSFSTVVGKTYIFSYEAYAGTAAPIVRLGSAQDGLQYFNGGAGSGSIIFTAATTTTHVSLWVNNNTTSGIYAEFDNISVRELPGNHAIQGTAAARPTLQTGTPAFLRDDTVDDVLNWTAPADTDYTIARLNSAGTVTILTGQSLSGATDIFLEQDIAAYLAVNRALTGAETTGLTTYLEALA